jgi:hypothetical protein
MPKMQRLLKQMQWMSLLSQDMWGIKPRPVLSWLTQMLSIKLTTHPKESKTIDSIGWTLLIFHGRETSQTLMGGSPMVAILRTTRVLSIIKWQLRLTFKRITSQPMDAPLLSTKHPRAASIALSSRTHKSRFPIQCIRLDPARWKVPKWMVLLNDNRRNLITVAQVQSAVITRRTLPFRVTPASRESKLPTGLLSTLHNCLKLNRGSRLRKWLPASNSQLKCLWSHNKLREPSLKNYSSKHSKCSLPLSVKRILSRCRTKSTL